MHGRRNLLLALLLIFIRMEVVQTFRDDVIHLRPLIQRGHRILKDHLHVFAEVRKLVAFHFAVDLYAVIINLSAARMADFHNGFSGRRLSGAGFSNQRKCFALVNVERHIPHSAEFLASKLKVDRQIPYGHKRLRV